ncbi:MAG: LBP/BPI/CETP family protein [Myxococcaceae bacterium]
MARHLRRNRRHELLLSLVALAVALGCSGSSGSASGCAALQPIPGGWYGGTKTDNAVNVRVSPQGINYINSNWRSLLDTFAPGQKLELPVGCMTNSGFIIADQGTAGCTAESCGHMDGKCCPTAGTSGCSASIVDAPKTVTATFTGFLLLPKPPDQIEATVTLSIDTGKIFVDSTDRSYAACAWLSPLKCSVHFSSAPPVGVNPPTNTLKATVKFTINTKWDKLLSFQVVDPLVGTGVCGASGVPAPPSCLDPDDIQLNGENNCGFYCDIGNIGFVKNLILTLISPMLQTQVKKAVEGQSCQACGTGLPPCPQFPGAVSTCDTAAKVCMDAATSKCVPRFLGLEGRIATSAFLGSFGVPPEAELDLSVAAGSSVLVDQGLSIGTRGGVNAVNVAECVPPLPAPPVMAVPAPDFDAEATPGSGYHVGLGVSQSFLNLAMHHAQQSGTLCIGMNSSTVGLLNTGLFKTFLPSLGRLATRDGKDAPMMIVLRPALPPTITVGEGTYDPITKKPIKPLILVTLPEVTVDFYAMFDDRYARLFSLTADISLPLSLIFEGCSTVQPALGDLQQLITNIKTANSEILAEDPKVLTDLIPAVIGLAEPAVAGALKPFAMPALGNFKLKVNESKGLSEIGSTGTYNHLGIYAQLMPLNAACAVGAPRTLAALKKSRIPAAEQMRLRGNPLPWPVAVLDVRSLGAVGTAEFAYRVDEGMWSTFLAADAHELEVSHPAFLIQGMHRIEVRSRIAEEPHGISAPVALGFRVDWEPPEVSLRAARETDRLEVSARDVVSAPEALQYAYRVGEGAYGDFGPARLVDLDAVEKGGGFGVRVRDEAGNVGEAVYRVPGIADRPEAAGPGPAAGCNGAGGAFSLLSIAAAALALLRRRARR